jgi:type I restriction enzyme M protein
MAHEQTKPPYNKPSMVPAKYNLESLLKREGGELEAHYRQILEELGKQPGMLGEIFKKARPEIQNPATLRRLIVDFVQPTVDDIVCDPAAGTGGFLLAAYDYVAKHQGKTLDKDQKKHLRTKFVKGWELVPNTARLCIMNLYLHGIDADPCPIKSGVELTSARTFGRRRRTSN